MGVPHPNDAFAPITGYVAFYPGRMDACFVDDERVVPQRAASTAAGSRPGRGSVQGRPRFEGLVAMELAILLFDRVTALDAVGTVRGTERIPEMVVRFVAAEPGVKRTANGSSRWSRTPLSAKPVARHRARAGWSRRGRDARGRAGPRMVAGAHETSQYTTSVCTGSLVLAAAGILRGVPATTHWLAMEHLAASVQCPSRSASWNTARSSPPQACRRVSTWRCCSRRASQATTSRGDRTVDRVRPATTVRRRLAVDRPRPPRRPSTRRQPIRPLLTPN